MDEYLKTLLEQIRCKKARPYIRQELQDHIEDQIAETCMPEWTVSVQKRGCQRYGRSGRNGDFP